jgi:hypothetical protein
MKAITRRSPPRSMGTNFAERCANGAMSAQREVSDGLWLRLVRQEPREDFPEQHEMLTFQILIQLG